MGRKGEKKKYTHDISITKECFFLELRSNVVWYSISTKFFRHGTLTSFFTAWPGKKWHVSKKMTCEWSKRVESVLDSQLRRG